MKITAALVREQGVNFAVVTVKQSAMQPANREQTQREFGSLFPGVPIVLMSQDHNGQPTYWGRRDLVAWLGNVFFQQLPWKEHTFAG
jgi:hypothetical protein